MLIDNELSNYRIIELSKKLSYMQITKSEIKDLTGVITMTVEPADYQEEVQKELRQIRQKANIPGFRPGMVPVGLVKKMYGKGVLADVINKTIGAKLGKYIESEKLNILGDPLPNEELTPEMDLDNQDTFTFAFDIAVAPEFNAKLDGKTKLTQYNITVTDEMVDNQVKSYASRFGEYVDAQEVEEGDVLKGLLKEVGNDTNPLQKENAMLNPQYMKDKKQAKLFLGKKLGDVVTFNPSIRQRSGSGFDAEHQERRGREPESRFHVRDSRHHAS